MFPSAPEFAGLPDWFEAAYRIHVAQERRRHAEKPCPSPEELAAYHDHLLSATADDKIQEHLTYCDRCSALVLFLARDQD